MGRPMERSAARVDHNDIGNVLLHAYPDRIAIQDSRDVRRYQLSNGRGAHVHQNSDLLDAPRLVVIDLNYAEGDSLITAAAQFDAGKIEHDFADRIVRERVVRWNQATRAAEASNVTRFADLVLDEQRVPTNPEDAHASLLAAIRSLGIARLPWSEAMLALRARIAAARAWAPELDLPDVGDEALLESVETWLGPFLNGKTRLDAVTPALLGEALTARLTHSQRRGIEEVAPEVIAVPSGKSHRIVYEVGKPPVLAVKLQELFGLADTPRVAKGQRAADVASALARATADPGHAGPAQLLGSHVSGSEERTERPLSETSVAGRSVVGHADAPRQAAREALNRGTNVPCNQSNPIVPARRCIQLPILPRESS